jgi:hypothetical protein
MIIEVSKQIAEGLDLTFRHGEPHSINLVADEVSAPVCMIINPINSNDIYHQTSFVEINYQNVQMLFLDLNVFEERTEKIAPVINAMRTNARKFFLSLQAAKQSDGSTPLVIPGSFKIVRVQEVFNQTDRNMSGILCTFNISFYTYDSACVDVQIPTTLCDMINQATVQEIINCLSNEKETELIAELCPPAGAPVNIQVNGVQTATANPGTTFNVCFVNTNGDEI